MKVHGRRKRMTDDTVTGIDERWWPLGWDKRRIQRVCTRSEAC